MTWNNEDIKSSDQTFSEISPLNTLDESNILNNNNSSIRRQTYTTKPDTTKDFYVTMDDFFDYINHNKISNICEMENKKSNCLPQSDVYESSGYSSLQRKNNNMAYVIGYDTEVSSNSSFSSSSSDPTLIIPGMAIQIDDNEYAVLGTLECDDNFSYKIYTPSEGDKMNFNSQLFETQSIDNIINKESRKLRKSLSFSTSKTNENFVGVSQDTLSLDSFSTIDESISTTQSTNNNNTNLIDNNLSSNDISTSQNKVEITTCKINHTSSEQHEHELYQNTHHLNNDKVVESYDKQENTITNIQKEINKTPSPLFENNGLFMRKEHQIFSQTYSRKVFVGGLPRDVSIDEIEEQFSVFGSVHVDWPNREDEIIPPNGFAFLHFDLAISVMKLYNSVNKYQSKNKYVVSSKSVKNKEVEIKFWKMSDSEILFVDRSWINPRRTVFVGALPRIATAYELADFMNKTFSGVAYAAIDVDLTFGYPKGAGRVTFTSDESYKKALDSHYVEMETKVNSKKKRIEIKPFLLPDQKCDACPSNRISRCANKYCYKCSQFICDNCEQNTYCMDKKRHNVVGRCIDQSQSPYDNCLS